MNLLSDKLTVDEACSSSKSSLLFSIAGIESKHDLQMSNIWTLFLADCCLFNMMCLETREYLVCVTTIFMCRLLAAGNSNNDQPSKLLIIIILSRCDAYWPSILSRQLVLLCDVRKAGGIDRYLPLPPLRPMWPRFRWWGLRKTRVSFHTSDGSR